MKKYYFSYVKIDHGSNDSDGFYLRRPTNDITMHDIKPLLKRLKLKNNYTISINRFGYMSCNEFGWDKIDNIVYQHEYFEKYQVR